MDISRFVDSVPWWAWLLLVLIIWRGIAAHSGRAVPLFAIMVQPAIFVVWGLATIKAYAPSSPALVLAAAASIAGGALLAARLTDTSGVRVDRSKQLIAVPASWWPMCRSLTIFAARFGLAVAVARLPQQRDALEASNVLVSGLSAGYFAVWAMAMYRAYRTSTTPM